MIDKKTREKIMNLWRDGESKASIGRKTKVSQPTIRKVIKEAELVREPVDDKLKPIPPAPIDLESRVKRLEEQIGSLKQSIESAPNGDDWSTHKIQPVDTFIINLTRNWPYRTNTPLQILRNGVPFWDMPRVLNMIYPLSIVNRIVNEIERIDTRGIYEVQVMHDFHGPSQITVQALRS